MKTIAIELDWPDSPAEWSERQEKRPDLGTQALPDELVLQPLSIGLWSYTPDPAEPRHGALSTWVRFSGKENPESWTDQEARYIIATLRRLIQIVAEKVTFESEIAQKELA